MYKTNYPPVAPRVNDSLRYSSFVTYIWVHWCIKAHCNVLTANGVRGVETIWKQTVSWRILKPCIYLFICMGLIHVATSFVLVLHDTLNIPSFIHILDVRTTTATACCSLSALLVNKQTTLRSPKATPVASAIFPSLVNKQTKLPSSPRPSHCYILTGALFCFCYWNCFDSNFI